MSALEPVHQDHVDEGIAVVSVLAEALGGARPTPADVEEWREALGLTYATWGDQDGAFSAEWNPDRRYPLAYVLDRDGEVVLTDLEGPDGVPALEAAAVAAL